jgi:hypothetical protein
MFHPLIGNLLNGMRLAALRPATFTASVGQLCALLALGWGAAFVADWQSLEGAVMISPWGITTQAARGYFGLATLAGLFVLCAMRESRSRGLLSLAVAVAAGDIDRDQALAFGGARVWC